MESIDDLLAELKAEYQQKQPNKPPVSPNNVSSEPQVPIVMNNSNSSSSPLDDLLAEVKSEFAQPQENKSKTIHKTNSSLTNDNSSVTENLLKQVRADLQKPISTGKRQPQSLKKDISKLNNPLIQELKGEFEEKKKEEEIRKQQQLIEAKKQEDLRRQRRRKALSKKAEEWLKKLDPNTEEGLWFEEFSYAYESKLEAAIDYLEALRETRA